MNIQDRFLKYVSFDTQSDPKSETAPSSTKQFELGKYLVEEMKSVGIANAHLDEFGIVYGTIPSNNNHQGKVIGFVAHMDTSPDASGCNIKPQIINDYDGSIITLNKEKSLYLDPKEFPLLLDVIHHDLITTDGTTLLGADDKAGIAIIMQMAEYLQAHPEFKHNDIQIAFTPDEEVGRGTENFNVDKFNADYAYTIDGGDIAEIEYENFNGFSAIVEITGKSIHPGSAKNKMINSIHISQEFDAMLPVHSRPESTEGYEGFNHLHDIH
ncbi:MAG: peptidase T, partial [Coprobacillus sp.]